MMRRKLNTPRRNRIWQTQRRSLIALPIPERMKLILMISKTSCKESWD